MGTEFTLPPSAGLDYYLPEAQAEAELFGCLRKPGKGLIISITLGVLVSISIVPPSKFMPATAGNYSQLTG